MSVLLVGNMTAQMSYLMASLQMSCIPVLIVEDIEKAVVEIGRSNRYSLILIDADIRVSEVYLFIEYVRGKRSNLLIIMMHALICTGHPKQRCQQSLTNKCIEACDAVDAAENIVLIMHDQGSNHSNPEYINRLGMIVDIAYTKVNALILQVELFRSIGLLDTNGLTQLYFNLLLIKDLNNIILLDAHEASSLS